MSVNGLLIDCVRLIERHEYYFHLIDFMSEWKMDMLILHFTDDQGCAVRLPGFENIAIPDAFTPREIKKLISYAGSRKIEIVPELETFGHTRYLTDRPEYRHLFAGEKTRQLKFNAVDPLNPETYRIMQKLIKAACTVFPGKYLHIGCDEVGLAEYCDMHPGTDEAGLWSDYVNKMIGLVKDCGKTPMLWGDHPAKSPAIARALCKDVALVYWNYEEDVTDSAISKLKKSGFRKIILAPSIACYRHRFHTTSGGIKNTNKMIKYTFKHKLNGVINTVWCPWRYLQGALYYGIAYSAESMRHKGSINLHDFDRVFVRRVFGTGLSKELEEFLNYLPELDIDYLIMGQLTKRSMEFTEKQDRKLRRINGIGKKIIPVAEKYQPEKNPDIWQAMVLSAKCAWLCSESYMLKKKYPDDSCRETEYMNMLRVVRRELSETWDKTRFPDDPRKYRTKFPGPISGHILIAMKSL